jgi:hypothetical protein
MIEDFGIIIACCDQDYTFARGCCASIRYFLGDTPIALIIDGTFDTSPLEQTYGVKVINQSTVSSTFLKERSFGFGLTKMIAFWESPWKHFLYLDADTVVWFNILKFANFQDYDVIIDKPVYDRSNSDISAYFFDIEKIGKYFPDFPWQTYRNYYFCTGAFFATRDIFTLDEYAEILDLVAREPRLFFPGEQGFLNFMLCRAAAEGRIRLGQEPIQLLVPDFDQQHIEKRFSFQQAKPHYISDDIIIHWCGPQKPVSRPTQTYSQPMTFFRRKFIDDALNHQNFQADIRLKIEDFQLYIMRYKNKVLRKMKVRR